MSSSARPQNRDAGNGVRFFVVDHPDKLKDKDELRKNRQHVMLDYLERTRPSGDNPCAEESGHIRKRKRTDSSLGCSANPSAPVNILRAEPLRASLTSSEDSRAISEVVSDNDDSHELVPISLSADKRDDEAGVMGAFAQKRTSVSPIDAASIVAGMSGRHYNHSYHGTDANTVPFTISRFGSSLNPFDTWPKFSEPSIDTNELKWSCAYDLAAYEQEYN